MNFKKLIFFIILFVGLSYYYFHHELSYQSEQKNNEVKSIKVLHLENDQTLNFLQIERNDQTITLEKNTHDDEWMITHPVSFPVDMFRLKGIISTLTVDQKTRDFKDQTFDFSKVGLDKPMVRIGIGYDNIKRFLLLGTETYIGSNYYARWEDSDEVFTVSNNLWNVFQVDFLALRKRTLLQIDFNNLEKVSINLPEYTSEFERVVHNEFFEWWVVAPIENRVITADFTDYLLSIQKLMISEFHDDSDYTDPQYGLIDSTYNIIFHAQNNIQKLIIGNMNPDTNTYYALLDGTEMMVSISKQTVDTFMINCADMIDKRIIILNPSRIEKLSFQKEERVTNFVYSGKIWNCSDPLVVMDDTKNEILTETVMFLSTLAYDSIIPQDVNILMERKESEKILTLVVEDIDRNNELTIFEHNNQFIVSVIDDPNLYVLEKMSYDRLNELLKSFL